METRILKAAADEISAALNPPPRILRVVREGAGAVAFHLEWRDDQRRGCLCLDVERAHPVLYLIPLSRARAEMPSGGFGERITGGTVAHLEAGPEPRIYLLRILGRPGGDEQAEWTLVAAWTGRSGNLRLLDGAGRILENLLPGGPAPGSIYRPPPPHADPPTAAAVSSGRQGPVGARATSRESAPSMASAPSVTEAAASLSSLEPSAWPKQLLRWRLATSPAAAVDAVLRGLPAAEEVLRLLEEPVTGTPGLYLFPRRAALPSPAGASESAWTAAELGLPAAEVSDRSLPSLQAFLQDRPEGLMELLARAHEILRAEEARSQEEQARLRTLQEETSRLLRLRAHLLAERGAPDTGPRLRRSGEAVLSNIHLIRKGQERFVCPDWTDPEGKATLEVSLEPSKAPAENAQVYFRLARRWERGEPHRRKRLDEIEKAVARLSMLRSWVAEAETPPRESQFRTRLNDALGFLKRAATEPPSAGASRQAPSGPAPAGRAGKPSAANSRNSTGRSSSPSGAPPSARYDPAAAARPRTFTTQEGWTLLVGRSNQENDVLTHKIAHPEDYWFHAHGVPGSHVVLRRAGRKDNPSVRTLEEAAAAAAFYSKARHSRKAPVIYTLKKYVRKPRGAKAGLAMCTREKMIMVAPRDPGEGREPEWVEE